MPYSLAFDGSNDHVTVANIGTLSSITVEVWVYNTDSANGDRYAQIVSRGANGSGWDWSLYVIPGNTLRWVGPGVVYIDTNVIPLNTWTHIAVTCNNVQTKIYINGALITTQSTTTTMTNQTSSVMFGNDVSVSRPYKGRLSNVRIWNVIRTGSEITNNYNTILTGSETGLIGNYKLESTSGSVAIDASPSARNGTLTNFTLSGSVSNWVDGSPSLGATPTIGALTAIPTKTLGTDVSFNITVPTTNSSGAFTYTSSNTGVATLNNLNPNALQFDGVNDTVTLSSYPALNSTNTLTLEAWIYITTQGNQTISVLNEIGGCGLALGKFGIGFRYTSSGWQPGVVSDTAIPINTWTHVAAVLNDGGYTKLYVNGTLVKSVAGSGNFYPCGGISLAANAAGSVDYSNIGISDCRIWTVARTAQQIADNYNIQIPSNSSGLVIYYKFNQGTANGTNTGLTTLTDSTSNNYHGTLTGFALTGATSNWVSGPNRTSTIVCTIVGIGTSTITATQASDATYRSGSVSTVLTVSGTQPTFGSFTLGPKAGAYVLTDVSFSLTAPTSDSSGAFWYASDNLGVATVTNNVGLSSQNPTLYSITSPAVRTLSLTNFPILGAMPTWEMNIRFTVTGGANSWRALIGDMYNTVNTGRGWGVWVSNSSGLHFSWNNIMWDATPIAVALNTEYVLKINRTPTSLTFLLTTVSTGATQTATNTAMSNTATYVMSVNGPVTIGGWINTTGEQFPGTFAYVTVINPNSAVNNACTSTNLLARYDASVASAYTLSGSNVTQWTDLTGNGYHLIPNGTGPTTTTINSMTSFNFNSGLGLYRTLVPLSTAITVFMVAKYSTAIATWGSFMHHGNRDTDWSLERNSISSGLTVQFQINNDNTYCQIAAANNTNYIWVGRITGNTRQFWMYSDTLVPVYVTSSTPAVTISGGNKTIYVGKSDNIYTSEACNSSIGEILYYNASLSDADVNANVIYLQNKWLYTKYVSYLIEQSSKVNLISNGTANITATQDASGIYVSKSVSSALTVGAIPTFGTFALGPKSGAYVLTDVSFSLTAPTSNSLGEFSFTSDNSAVAIVRHNFKSSNLVARYDASVASGYTLSGSNVTQWNDLTGNGYHLTTNGTGPTLTTINSITALSFASSRGLATSAVPKTKMVTVFIVIKYSSNISGYGTYIQHGNRDHDWSIRNSSGTSNLVINTSGDNASPALAAVNGLNYIFVARLNDSSREIWRYSDSSTATTNYAIASGNTNSLSGGGGYTNNIYVGKSEVNEASQGIIGEILYYNTALSDAGVSANVDYLQNKWFYNIHNAPSISLISIGTANITATQDACGNYVTKSVSSELSITSIIPSLGTFTVATTKVYGDAAFSAITLPTSNSSGAITYSSSNTAVATINASGTLITLVGAGTVTFTATQAATSQYAGATKTSTVLTVSISTTVLTGMAATLAKNVTDASFVLQATSASSGAITYSTSNSLYATVITNTANNTGVVTLMGAGTVTITATQAATALYTAATATCVITVSSAGTALAGQTISPGTSFSGVDLSGASFAGSTLSGVSFAGAKLTGVNFSGAVITGTNFTNANINGATNLPTFSTAQKLQLLLNVNNSGIGAAQINNVITGAALNAALASPITGTAGEDIAAATFVVRAPTSLDASDNKVISIDAADISNNTSIYIPLNENETVKINGVRYTYNGSTIVDASEMVKNYILISGVPFKVYSGSIIAVNVYAALAQFKIGGFDIITVCNDLLVAR